MSFRDDRDEPAWLLPCASAVERFFAERTSPRDAIASPHNRRLPHDDRALLARMCYAAIRDERRSAFLLGPACDDLSPGARALALVLAAAVAAGEFQVGEAEERFAQTSGAELDFARVVDPEPSIEAVEDEVERFALHHSMPDWIARILRSEFGAEAEALARSLNEPAPRTIRANRLVVADRSALASRLADEGISTATSRFAPDALQVIGEGSLFETKAYREGAFEQQDEGSQLVAACVAPPPKGRVLDACAGAGGKTLAICAMLQNKGRVIAADVHERRVAEFAPRAARAKAFNAEAVVVPEDHWPEAVGTFASSADRILLDVPCSGIGSWRRRPEARSTLQPQDLENLVRVQRDLLDRAIAALRPGSRVVYATCTLLRRENEEQIEGALQRHAGLEVVRLAELFGKGPASAIADASGTFLSVRPDRHGTDGFFAAVLRKKR